MVQELERKRQGATFPESAPAANPVFFRTYSRRTEAGLRETWEQLCDRTLRGLVELGKLTRQEATILDKMQRNMKSLPSGRWMWVGGTDWLTKPKNFSGAYNCTSTNLVDWKAFGLMMDLAMMGCGTGAIIEPEYINQLPSIRNPLSVTIRGEIGSTPLEQRREFTQILIGDNTATIHVGDSREGWVKSYQTLLELSTDERFTSEVQVIVDINDVRQSRETLKGFGGMANPVKLPGLYQRCASILNQAIGRQLNSVECCLLIDEAAVTIVAGNIRRSAGIRQFISEDEQGATAKDNLWQQDAEGNWRIDPERDSLRMANHTRVFHRKPTLEESIAAVQKQYYSGEGAIQWAGEAVARANADLLNTPEIKRDFLRAYEQGKSEEWIQRNYPEISDHELEHRMGRFGLNPCGEIIGNNFHCNLSEVHLNQLDPDNYKEQEEAFTAGALSVVALLNHQFIEPRYQYSRELDPIVGVSFTGLFDFFVHAFGTDWLRWWEAGRPETPQGLIFKSREQKYLNFWKDVVHKVIWEYCDRHQIKRPNRCTTVQPAGTKSLLTGASPGWHPPKSQRFIRRITFRKNDPVALACIDYGYNVIPSQSDKDENGNLLNNAFDPRCTEWLVEIPVAVSWADLPGADIIDVSQFSVLAQLDFVMEVQNHYVTHNTSATLELRSEEVELLGTRIYEAIQNDEGYISAALLARFDDLQSFPRLPFEPIDKATYERLSREVKARRKTDDFCGALSRYDLGELSEAGPSGCDSDKCMFPEQPPTS
ncbi:ribonucleoside-triphosphate reductase, adenosylcobalamin-dependent [Aphanizomenon flos-aquae NRERC-008]|uniref:Ribonucleoside-triphosphate reductase, adenosylcobalamin-dependent n=1 Tax=Aphanizomenon flos-aquae FACHB-1249 TaxID=2692889 RepID=A0ABR8IUL3_APHFL|nr:MULTISPECIES: ribonucleoside-triphosphate reductase, adenosylcobalamin-dependent [Aphanizomenon]MBD2390380.1 ribonucleoside-triphosphate reductase, adenosylcobalamin-dependent [Aphanizomenon flos-aquae FACHB-1171]MBD2557781.1 ribonucleoside-triphosphate reductase, adenosylcobalamin-dependent [Aphanizomenon flos-aquae FACHB-1290]MBD2632661.1 ribonucleoside-triphosphate reductase, adenosylcobalamin-dependent [Aphanizomenon sp. FACHB-1399]MBD2643594.1 ribonucleoside-triphosphate reductase, aden